MIQAISTTDNRHQHTRAHGSGSIVEQSKFPPQLIPVFDMFVGKENQPHRSQ
jgi:hypothetical protein